VTFSACRRCAQWCGVQMTANWSRVEWKEQFTSGHQPSQKELTRMFWKPVLTPVSLCHPAANKLMPSVLTKPSKKSPIRRFSSFSVLRWLLVSFHNVLMFMMFVVWICILLRNVGGYQKFSWWTTVNVCILATFHQLFDNLTLPRRWFIQFNRTAAKRHILKYNLWD